MSKSLYEEAVADAQKLRELAEETAKNRVVEAVMPKIRDMVNRRILGEQVEEFSMDDFEDSDEASIVSDIEVEPEAPIVQQDDSGVQVQASGSEAEARNTRVRVSAEGDIEIDVTDEETEKDSDEEGVLTDTMAEALGRLLRGESEESIQLAAIEEKLFRMRKILESNDVDKMSKPQKYKFNCAFNHCLREVYKLHRKVILSEQKSQGKLEQRLAETIKEMKHMSKSHRRNIFDLLFEESEQDQKEAEGLEEAELSLELEDTEVEDLAAAEDADAVDAALEDILAGIELEVGVGEELEDEDAGEAVEVGEEEVEVEEEVVEEADMEEMDMSETMYEIDESVLRRELRRMRRLREQEEGRAAEADPALAHGGEELGDVILDVSEDDLLNALADELGDPSVPEPVVERRRRTRARRSTNRRRVSESRQVKQYRNALSGMKKQLVEMNLFNAKLLYANKLMQNKNLTVKQQRAIVEALDNAKTLREAKLLYKSLSESLTRRARGKKLNEGALRTLGSSSRSTRSGSPANSGVEVDRWAVLAGMNPGND